VNALHQLEIEVENCRRCPRLVAWREQVAVEKRASFRDDEYWGKGVGFANQPESIHKDDGLELANAWVTSPVKCAPPANKPTPDERASCRPFLTREFEYLRELRVVVALGGIGYQAVAQHLGVKPRPKFGHGVEVPLESGLTILCSYHVSQQNTFTGRLTEDMLDSVFSRAQEIASTGVR